MLPISFFHYQKLKKQNEDKILLMKMMILKMFVMKKNVIVSLADSNYFPLLNELIDSIKRFKESENVAICILDAG
jgi:hypothetical protein